MGISDSHIHKIKSVDISKKFCPECGKNVMILRTDTGDNKDCILWYCKECNIFFDWDDGYFTDGETKGMEKLNKILLKGQ